MTKDEEEEEEDEDETVVAGKSRSGRTLAAAWRRWRWRGGS